MNCQIANIKYRILLLVSLWLLSFPIYGQVPYLQIFNDPEYLNNSTIYRITSDQNNLIYFGSDKGLFSFNGVKFAKIPTDSLLDQEIIYIDSDCFGNIWGSDLSLQIFVAKDSLKKIFTDLNKAYEAFFFSCLADLFILQSRNYNNINLKVYKINPVGNLDSLLLLNKYNGSMSTFLKNRESIHWLIFDAGHVDLFEISKLKESYSLSSRRIVDNLIINPKNIVVLIDYEEEKYVELYNRPNLYKINLQTKEIDSIYSEIPIHGNCKLSSQNLYYTPKGMFTYNQIKQKANPEIELSFNSHYRDRNNILWLSGYNGGLYMELPIKKGIDISFEKFSSSVTASTLISDSILLVGNTKGDLIEVDHRKGILQKKKLFESRITSIVNTNKGIICVSDNEIASLDNDFNLKFKVQFESVKHILEKDDNVYLSTATNFFKSKTEDVISGKSRFESIINQRTLSSIKFKKNIIVGTKNGVYLYKDGNTVSPVQEFNNLFISKLKQIDDQEFWVFTNGRGIYCLRDMKIVYNSLDSTYLLNNSIDIIKVNNDYLVSFDKGILLLDQHFKIKERYFESDGISVTGVVALFNLMDKILVVNKYGFQTVTLSSLNLTRSSPSFYFNNITSITSNVISKDSIFDKENNYLQFNYEVIDYNFPKELKFFYKLEPLDLSFKSTSIPLFTYSNLPPGKYKLTAYAENVVGLRSPLAYSPVVVIRNVWYNTTLFYLLAALASIITPLALLRYYYNTKRKNEEKEAMLEKQIQELSYETLKLQIRPHFILDTLNAIQNLILKNMPNDAINAISVFGKMLRSILYKQGSNTSTIKEELDFIKSYFEIENLRFRKNLLLKININPIHEKEVLEFNIPSLILQPLVENSIIHGFPDDFPVNGQILIDFDYRKDRLICLVKDNGKGFSDGKYNFGGIGLQNVQNRINMYNYGLIKKQTGFLNIFREDGYTTAKIVIYGKF